MRSISTCFVCLGLIVFSASVLTGCNFAANRHNLDGKRRFEVGQLPNALQSFQLALQNDPANANAHYNIGRTLHQIGKSGKDKQALAKAETAYRETLRLDPFHQPAYRGLAVLLVESDRKPESFQLLQNWIRLQPDSAEPRVELARIYRESGDRVTATQLLSDALAVDFDNDRALRAIGALREEAGDVRQALLDYQRSLELNPMQPELAARVSQLRLAYGQPVTDSNRRLATRPADFPRF